MLVPAILFHFTQLLSCSFISVKWTPKTPQLPVQEAPEVNEAKKVTPEANEKTPVKEGESSPKTDVKSVPSNDSENAPVSSVKDLSQSTVEMNATPQQGVSSVCHKHEQYDTN